MIMRNLKRYVVTFVVLLAAAEVNSAPPSGYCDVTVCNKLERFTLSPWSAIKDRLGEQCLPALLAKEDAIVGKVLDSGSRWYQGSFNPTKKSVTRVKYVRKCTEQDA